MKGERKVEEILMMIKRVTLFILISGLFTNLFAGTEYKKYIQFSVGLMVIVLALTPILSIFGKEQNFSGWLEKEMVEEQMLEKKKEIEILGEQWEKEWQQKYMEEMQLRERNEEGEGT